MTRYDITLHRQGGWPMTDAGYPDMWFRQLPEFSAAIGHALDSAVSVDAGTPDSAGIKWESRYFTLETPTDRGLDEVLQAVVTVINGFIRPNNFTVDITIKNKRGESVCDQADGQPRKTS